MNASHRPTGPRPTPDRHRHRRRGALAAVVVVVGLIAAACGGSESGSESDVPPTLGPAISESPLGSFPDGTTITVVTHDSFAVSEDVLQSFTDQTGVTVQLLPSGDAATMVNKAILTAGNPEGDVLYGIDENLLSAAFDAEVFVPFEARGLSTVPEEFQVDAEHRVTPIDHGDVCVNYDRSWFTDKGLPLPTGFEDLVDPSLEDALVVQDPTSSTPGLAFMLATIASQGGAEDTSSSAPWVRYWQQLKDNGVKVVDGWETAYNVDFSGSAGQGDRPLVVSYASSPPFEVTDPTTPADQAPTGVMADTCFRQTEFAGVLRGSENPDAAAAFVEFMLSLEFQQDVPEQMYVFPVNSQAVLPEAWVAYTTPVEEPLSIPFEDVGANREAWIDQWAAIFR